MKKLLLLALPLYLLCAFVARAEEASIEAPVVDQVAAAPAPAPDPKVEEFNKIANSVFDAVTEHVKAIQELYNNAFADHKDLLAEIGKSYPDAVGTLPDGGKVLAIHLGSIGIGPF